MATERQMPITTSQLAKLDTKFVQKPERVKELLQSHKGKVVAIDTETTGLLWYKDDMIGLGLYCDESGTAVYIPTLTDYDRRLVKFAFNSYLPEGSTLVVQNGKFDFHFLGYDHWPHRHETTILDVTEMAHLIDSRDRKNLGNLEKKYLGSNSKRSFFEEAAEKKVKGKDAKNIWKWPLERVSTYCVNDCIVTFQLAQVLLPEIQMLGLWDLMQKDIDYMALLWRIERKGIYVDEIFTSEAKQRLEHTLGIMEQDLFDSIGYEFNWRSPWQLSKAIYEDMGIPKPKNPFADADGVDRSRFADAGKYKSTCTATFILTEKINHPLGGLISDLRECTRLIQTIRKWMELRDENGYVHPNFNYTGTRTGRLSCSKPNAQNVPAQARGRFTQSVYTGDTTRAEEYNLRRGFIADPGCAFLSIDYKQMEGRFFGIISKDPFMLKTLIAGKDLHMSIAMRVWGESGEEMNRIHREWSKTITFGLIYGMTIGSLMYKLNMTRGQAALICDQYWGEFPRIKPWMDEVIEECRTFGYVRYWSGRIWRESFFRDMYRAANALIQGGCADLLSMASLRTYQRVLERWNGLVHIVNLVHDEIMLQVPRKLVLEVAREIATVMEVEDLLGFPFLTDCKVGITYGSQRKIPKEWVDDPTMTDLPEDFWEYDPYKDGIGGPTTLSEEFDDETWEEYGIRMGFILDPEDLKESFEEPKAKSNGKRVKDEIAEPEVEA